MAKSGFLSPLSDYEKRFIRNYGDLAKLIESYRSIQDHATIGFVSGVWDMIHLGHMAYIEKAGEGLDILVVGVDTDEFTRSKKKTDEVDRPIVGFEERSRILSYMRAVNVIVPIDSYEGFDMVLEAVKPDRLVFSRSTFKAGQNDIKPANRKKYQKHAKEIVILDPQAPPDKVSTTVRVRTLMMQGVKIARSTLLTEITKTVDDTFDKIEESL